MLFGAAHDAGVMPYALDGGADDSSWLFSRHDFRRDFSFDAMIAGLKLAKIGRPFSADDCHVYDD